MILNLVQTNKEMYSAKFSLQREDTEVGNIGLKGKMTSMEGNVKGFFYSNTFEMSYGKSREIRAKAFRPYRIQINEADAGVVYQTERKTGFFRSYPFHQMLLEGQEYDLFMVEFREKGARCPVYLGDKIIAEIDKDYIVYDDLHKYEIYAVDVASAEIAVLFALYMYVIGAYKPGEKMKKSVHKILEQTKEKELINKYDPEFKKTVML